MTVDIYQTITDNMIAALESATGNFVMPWNANPQMPTNLNSKKAYRGLNVMQLWAVAMLKEYKSPYWVTFKGAKELGGMVRKGEKATPVIFWKMIKTKDKETGEDKQVPLARWYNVFNTDQVDGIEVPEPIVFENDSIDAIEALVKKTKASINFGGEKAAYNWRDDQIFMPSLERFHSTEAYYETLLHELTHWTGHATRCNRLYVGKHGLEEYAKEELIAEMGSAFLCAHFGIKSTGQHPEYLKSWLQVLRDDKEAIKRAAGAAQIAADFVLGTKFDEVKEAA